MKSFLLSLFTTAAVLSTSCFIANATTPAYNPDANAPTPQLTKQFTLQPASNLEVQTPGGHLNVKGISGNKAKVELIAIDKKKQQPSMQEVEEHFTIVISQEGDRLIVSAKQKHPNKGQKMSISFTIEVPMQTSASLKTSGGHIDAQHLTGKHSFNTSGGHIDMKRISGDAEVKTSGGNIAIEHYDGQLDAATSGGSIKLQNARGTLTLKTAGGSITLEEVAGTIYASTAAGSIAANVQHLGESIILQTSAGAINVTLPKDLGLDLNLKGSLVEAQLASFNGEHTQNKIIGQLNGGGKKVDLQTAAGKVSLLFE